LEVVEWLTESQQMQPVAAAAEWNVPAIESAGALSDWLLLDRGELACTLDYIRSANRTLGREPG